jgi:multiple sugar transport system permease protein
MNTLAVQKRILIVCFLVIPVVLLLLFVVYPTVQLFLNSLTSWDGISATKEFIGLKNYKEMLFNSQDVWTSLKNNAVYFIVHLLFIPLELMIAIILDSKIKASGFFKTVTFLPYVVNGVAIAYAFSFFYSPYNGALNEILKSVGMEWATQNWLSNEKIVNFSLVAISLWKFSGFHVVLFLSGLQSIPKDILEASVIDGANSFQKYVNIIVPSIALVIDFILFHNMRGALQVFDIPFLVTQGGPGYASSTFTLYTIDTAFKYNNFGMASSMGITLLIMIIILSSIQKRMFKALGRG